MITINNRDTLSWQEGMTVTDMLKKMKYDYSLIVVSVDGHCIPEERYEHYALRPDANVQVIHICHGG